MVEILLLLSLIIFSCVLLSRISSRIGVPSLLAFILLGMFFGADGPLAINFDNFELVRDVCTFALVFIMFYGGFSTNWRQARPVAVKAFLLSSLGVVLTAALVLDDVTYFVLDEADEMLRMGFAEDVETIAASLPEERRTSLFSATMPPAIQRVARQHRFQP